MIVDNLEFANVAMLLHDAQELDDDLGRRTDKNLALATSLGIDNAVEAVVEDGNANHLEKEQDLKQDEQGQKQAKGKGARI